MNWTSSSDFIRPKWRWSWVFLNRTLVLSGIQFTRHVIEFVVVETKQFVGSYGNAILSRQNCGQRSSMSAESRHLALVFFRANLQANIKMYTKLESRSMHFFGTCETRTAAQLRLPKKKGFARRKNENLVLCSSFSFHTYPKSAQNRIMSVYRLWRTVVPHLLQAKIVDRHQRAHQKLLLVAPTFTTGKIRIWYCTAVLLFARTQKVHRFRSQSPVHFDTGTCGKFARENYFLALWPKDMLSALQPPLLIIKSLHRDNQ